MVKRHVSGVLSLEERLARGAISFEDDPGLTEQSHRDSCDINRIMANYEKTGLVPVNSSAVPRHGDFTYAGDYHEAMNMLIAAQDSFMDLPAHVRKEYDNDPARFLDALEDPTEKAKLVALGVFIDDQVPKVPDSIPDASAS